MSRAIFLIAFAIVMMTALCDAKGGCDDGNDTIYSNIISNDPVK